MRLVVTASLLAGSFGLGCASAEPVTVGDNNALTANLTPPPVSICTSGVKTSPDEEPTEGMNPGMACITCHSTENRPFFAVAGTVYPTDHEPDSCAGVAEVKVLIIDADGNVHTKVTNDRGNFFSGDAIPLPYRAMLVQGSKLRSMRSPQTNGDCNSCHTEWGNSGASGRLRAP
jgi:hypothetical protein